MRLTLVVSGNDIVWKDGLELSEVTISALQMPGQRLMVFPVGERHAAMLHDLLTQDESKPDAVSNELKDELKIKSKNELKEVLSHVA